MNDVYLLNLYCTKLILAHVVVICRPILFTLLTHFIKVFRFPNIIMSVLQHINFEKILSKFSLCFHIILNVIIVSKWKLCLFSDTSNINLVSMLRHTLKRNYQVTMGVNTGRNDQVTKWRLCLCSDTL